MNERPSLDALRIDRSRQKAPLISRGFLIGTAAALALLGAGGVAAWHFWPADGVPVHVAAAQSDAASASSTLDASGYVVAERSATLSAKVSGKLVEANFQEGDRVTAGQIVARLDDFNTRAALNNAVAQEKMWEGSLADARAFYQRYQKLRAQGAVSEDALQTQKTTYDTARLNLDVARTTVAEYLAAENDMVVRAPFSGVVTQKVAQVGEIVAPAAGGGSGGAITGIAALVDMDSLEVDVDVSEDYIDRVVAGQKATVTLNAYPDWEIPASVIAVIPTADKSKGTVTVRVGFDTKDKRILPQMGARVSFLASANASQAPASHSVTIPQTALQGTGENASVFLIKPDDTVEVRPVSPGAKNGQDIIIRAGLEPGDRVAVDDFEKLSDGVKVAVQP